MGFLRGFLVVVSACCLANAFGQQGQGGGGAGGAGFGGGGFGGGNMNNQLETGPNRVVFPGKKNETGELNGWTAKNIILTPGDKVEWKFTAKRGQVIFATADSDAFDPAIAIVDAMDKVLIENDDQYEGEQSPYVSTVIKKDGDYKLLVRNYRSTSGGRFTLYTKFADSYSVIPGNNLLEVAKKENSNQGDFYLAVNAEKGKLYGVLRSQRIFKEATGVAYFEKLIGPSGVSDLDFIGFKSMDEDTVFEARQTGTYLLHYRSYLQYNDKPFTLGFSLSEIKSETLNIEGDALLSLLPGQQKLLRMEVKKGLALYSTINYDEGIANIMSFDQKLGTPRRYVSDGGFQWIPKSSSNGHEGFRLFGADGTVNFVVCNASDKPGTLTMKNGIKLDELNTKGTVNDHLGIGEAHFFWLSGTKLEMQHISAASKQMELNISLLDEDLHYQQFEDTTSHAPSSILNYDKPKRYLVTVTSAGRGGSGDYTLHFDRILPTKVGVGASTTVASNSAGMALYEATLEKDVYYELVVRAPEGYAVITDFDGLAVASQTSYYNGVRAYRFRATKSGPHRIYFAPSQVGGKFRLDKAVIPIIDK